MTNGLFTVALGDTTLAGMENPIPPAAFDNPNVRLRIWFNDGASGFAQLAPDQRLTSVGYAMRAANVADGAITGEQIAPGSITNIHLANHSVSASKLTDPLTLQTLNLGSINWDGTLNLYAKPSAGGGIVLPTGDLRARLSGQHANGLLELFGETGFPALRAYATGDGGALRLDDDTGDPAVSMGALSTGGGLLNVWRPGGSFGVNLSGGGASDPGGEIILYHDSPTGSRVGLFLDGNGTAGGGEASLRDIGGTNRIKLTASTSGGQGALLQMMNGLGGVTVSIDADASGRASVIQLLKSDGAATITLDADSGGEGRITTQVLQITGGSDLSENFDIQTPDARPGMIVSIDPAHPGELSVSARAYDRTVAGVVSGAGGVKPGLLMGQRNTRADGKHPVALTGRVYCLVDASAGAIEPGDLITTSATPGHGMKVSDPVRAQGAIIGKAMTALVSGKGLVLVLVSLQ